MWRQIFANASPIFLSDSRVAPRARYVPAAELRAAPRSRTRPRLGTPALVTPQRHRLRKSRPGNCCGDALHARMPLSLLQDWSTSGMSPPVGSRTQTRHLVPKVIVSLYKDRM